MDVELLSGKPFQSTLPYGSDLRTWAKVMYTTNFNPRSLTGATQQRHYRKSACGHFNPRSLTGATWLSPRSCGSDGNFNPRSLTGATPGLFVAKEAHRYFNPRSLTGATSLNTLSKSRLANFNPRSLTGATASKQITSLLI